MISQIWNRSLMRTNSMKNDPFYLKKVAVRLVEEPPLLSKEPLNSPEKAVNALAEEIRSYDREVVAVINMHTDSN